MRVKKKKAWFYRSHEWAIYSHDLLTRIYVAYCEAGGVTGDDTVQRSRINKSCEWIVSDVLFVHGSKYLIVAS